MTKKIVVALGGNAILTSNPTAEAQKEALKYTSEILIKLVKEGHSLIITHGNGLKLGTCYFNSTLPILKKTLPYPWIHVWL